MYEVCITNKRGEWDTSHTGKGKFFARLIPALRKLGVNVTTDASERSDIDLQIHRLHYKPNADKLIMREGPFTIDSNMNYKKLNKVIWKSMKKADGIIYQSKFAKKLGRKFVGKPKCPETIIFNGADPEYYKSIDPMESPFKYNFLASARQWHPQKRLKQTIKAFKLADIEDSCLWIAGNILGKEKKYKCDNIRFVGLLDDKTLGSYYRLCDAMIDLTYLSACPNNVVEALVAGCPVICTDQGGSKELLQIKTIGKDGIAIRNEYGYLIKDKEYNFKSINLNNPPKMIHNDAFYTVSAGWIKKNFTVEHLHIDNIARQYKNFFEKVLYGKYSKTFYGDARWIGKSVEEVFGKEVLYG